MPIGVYKRVKHWKLSEETKRKIGKANSLSLLGRKLDTKVKTKISDGLKKAYSSGGRKPWNKGLPAWNKGTKKLFYCKKCHGIKRKNSILCQKCNKGKNHYNYKGGKPRSQWKKENKDKVNFSTRIRRYLIKSNIGRHSLEDWENIKKKFNFTCVCCGRKEPEVKLTEDHIIPLSKNGSNNIENIQPLCKSCNSKKSTKEIDFTKTFSSIEY